jgi:hypothetical protein
MRDWAGAQRILDEALRIWPADLNFLAIKAQIFQANGQLDQAQLIVDKLKPDRLDYDAVGAVWYQAKLQRKPATALKRIEPLARRTDSLKEWVRDAQVLGDLQQLSRDTVGARATFGTVRDVAAPAGTADNAVSRSAFPCVGWNLRTRQALQAIDKKISLQSNDARVQLRKQRREYWPASAMGTALWLSLSHLQPTKAALFGPPSRLPYLTRSRLGQSSRRPASKALRGTKVTRVAFSGAKRRNALQMWPCGCGTALIQAASILPASRRRMVMKILSSSSSRLSVA